MSEKSSPFFWAENSVRKKKKKKEGKAQWK